MRKSPVKHGKHLVDVGLDDAATVAFVEDVISPIEKRTVSRDGKIMLENRDAAVLAELARNIEKVYPSS